MREGRSTLGTIKIIDVHQSVFAENDRIAGETRRKLKENKTFLLNLMASPGAGKTSTLLQLLERLRDTYRIGVIEADIDGVVDAEKMEQAGVTVVQAHTGGECAMDAQMTKEALEELLEKKQLELVILENVGNLVCPAETDTGASKNAVILSVPEGDDKPLKYPLMFERCQLLIVNKIDTVAYFDFDREKLMRNAKMRNPKLEILFVSAKTGEGMDELAAWMRKNIEVIE